MLLLQPAGQKSWQSLLLPSHSHATPEVSVSSNTSLLVLVPEAHVMSSTYSTKHCLNCCFWLRDQQLSVLCAFCSFHATVALGLSFQSDSVEISKCTLLESIRRTVVRKRLFTNSFFTSSTTCSACCFLVFLFRFRSCSLKLYSCLSRSQPPSLYALPISRQMLQVADVSHCTGLVRNHPNLVLLPLAISSNIAQLLFLLAK